MSKITIYENPYSVIGTIELTDSDWWPTDIYVKIMIMEQGKLRMWRFYHQWNINKENTLYITYFNLSESDGMKQRYLL